MRCEKCGSLRLELIGERSIKGKNVKVYACRVCGAHYYICPYCGEMFTSLQALGGHLRKHRYDELDRILEWLGVEPQIAENLKRLEMEPKEVIILLVLKDIRDRLDRLETSIVQLKNSSQLPPSRPSRNTTPATTTQASEGSGDTDMASLPSFTRDNPWLHLLAKR